MTLNSTVKSAEGVIHTELEGEVVLMHVADGKYYALNAVGSAVWLMISSQVTVFTICEAIQQEFDVEPDVCRQDVIALLEQLRGAGLLYIDE